MVKSSKNETIQENVTFTEAFDGGEFDWSSSVQSIILGSFYACYVLSQVRKFPKRKKKFPEKSKI